MDYSKTSTIILAEHIMGLEKDLRAARATVAWLELQIAASQAELQRRSQGTTSDGDEWRSLRVHA